MLHKHKYLTFFIEKQVNFYLQITKLIEEKGNFYKATATISVFICILFVMLHYIDVVLIIHLL